MDDNFSINLKNAMNDSNCNIAKLSRCTGISKSSISEYLKGKFIPKYCNTLKIAEVLNVSPDWLYNNSSHNNCSQSIISKKLLYLKDINGIKNIKEMARLIDIPYTTLKDLIDGITKNVRIDTGFKICNYFKLTLDELFNDSVDLQVLLNDKKCKKKE